MGHGTSRKIIEYDEAVARMGRREAAAIEAGFGRLAAGGTLNRVNWRTGFLGSFTGTPVPEALAAALFDGFDADADGYLTVKEFVCGLAVLRHGTPQEKIRLLFSIYDADRDKRLSDRDLARFAETLGRGREAPIQHTIDEALKSLAPAGSSVGVDRFMEWARNHMNSPLVAWIFDMEQRISQELDESGSMVSSLPSDATDARSQMVPLDRTVSSTLRAEAEELCRISEETGAKSSLLEDMHAAWKAAAKDSKFEVVDKATFLSMLPSASYVRGSESSSISLAERFFQGLDQTRSGTISLRDWCYGLGLCMEGSAAVQRDFCFRLFSEGDPAGGVARTVDAVGARELKYFASLAAAIFSTRPDSASGLPSGAPLLEPELKLSSFDAEPWASEAVALVRALGQLARIDLKLRPDPREEREIVDRLNAKFDAERPGRVGDTWCLISAKWWQMWCEFSGPDAEDAKLQQRRSCGPPSIDNTCLVDTGGWLQVDLYHGSDYELITAAAWRALWAWYGGPGPALCRQVINLDGLLELEMYLLRLQVSRTNEAGHELLEQRTMSCSRTYKLGEVRQLACALYELTRPAHLFHRSNQCVDWQAVDDESATVNELGFVDGHCLLLQLADAQQSGMNFPTSPKLGARGHGTVGLQNLGNSCYMNSSLQCLLHTPMLGDYFSDMYCYDLNVAGTWGMAGKLAVAFAELVNETRRAQMQGTSVAPRSFKRVIGDYHTAFAGWRQQDAQEFLSVFLSGLSEDVNRVLTKPYVELKDSEGRPDDVVAEEFWTAHCQRERSVIAALFSGQFKSVIRCSKCGHDNAAFDPFTFLPVPLPEHDFRWITCTVVSRPRAGVGQHTVQVCARVSKRGQVSDLLHAVAGIVGLDEAELLAADIAEHYVFKIHEAGQALSFLGEDVQPTVFHAPSPLRDGAASDLDASMGSTVSTMPRPSSPMSLGTGDSSEGVVTICLVHRRLRKVTTYFRNPYRPELFATPVLLRLPAKCSAAELHGAAWRLVRHLVPDFEIGPPYGRWPFSLSRVTRDGTACNKCGWRQGCLGCVVPTSAADGGEEPLEIQLSAQDTLGIDWDASVLNQFFKAKIAAHIHVHESVELARIERSAPERLSQCLDCLVKPEELEVYCRECTKTQGEFTETCHAKSLQIWGCPPLLLLQLKRFHSGAGVSYKLQNLVDFPMRLDLREYLAGVSPAAAGEVAHVEENEVGEGSNDGAVASLKGWDRPLREREPAPEVLHTLSRSTTEYQLYAVVNHIGTMGGGHYTAFVRAQPDRWLCCNDSQVYPISEEDIVTANAYLLFYERSDVVAQQSESLGLDVLIKLGFPAPDPKATKVDPEKVRRAHWVRRGDGEKGSSYGVGAGFCGVM